MIRRPRPSATALRQPPLQRGQVHRARRDDRRGVRNVGAMYETEVSDTGIGIAPDMLPYVFERYRQADSSTSRQHARLGIGLSIVKELTELHGGSVTAESAGEGYGAAFRVRIPRFHATRVLMPGPGDACQGPRAARLDGVRLLAIDDNPEALEGLATALRTAGAVVRTACSGPDALELGERVVPTWSSATWPCRAWTVSRCSHQIQGRGARSGRRTPVIAVSAHATQAHRQRSLDAGFFEHVAKPYRIAGIDPGRTHRAVSRRHDRSSETSASAPSRARAHTPAGASLAPARRRRPGHRPHRSGVERDVARGAHGCRGHHGLAYSRGRRCRCPPPST